MLIALLLLGGLLLYYIAWLVRINCSRRPGEAPFHYVYLPVIGYAPLDRPWASDNTQNNCVCKLDIRCGLEVARGPAFFQMLRKRYGTSIVVRRCGSSNCQISLGVLSWGIQ